MLTKRQKLRKKLLLLKKKVIIIQNMSESKVKRRYWVHPINRLRQAKGVYHNLLQELRNPQFSDRHRQYMRMSYEHFDHLLQMIKDRITKQDTVMRKAIEPGLKLAVTLHHLSQGSSFQTIAQHYRLGRLTVSNIIYDTCRALWELLQPVYLKPPQGPADWIAISEG